VSADLSASGGNLDLRLSIRVDRDSNNMINFRTIEEIYLKKERH